METKNLLENGVLTQQQNIHQIQVNNYIDSVALPPPIIIITT